MYIYVCVCILITNKSFVTIIIYFSFLKETDKPQSNCNKLALHCVAVLFEDWNKSF